MQKESFTANLMRNNDHRTDRAFRDSVTESSHSVNVVTLSGNWGRYVAGFRCYFGSSTLRRNSSVHRFHSAVHIRNISAIINVKAVFFQDIEIQVFVAIRYQQVVPRQLPKRYWKLKRTIRKRGNSIALWKFDLINLLAKIAAPSEPQRFSVTTLWKLPTDKFVARRPKNSRLPGCSFEKKRDTSRRVSRWNF